MTIRILFEKKVNLMMTVSGFLNRYIFTLLPLLRRRALSAGVPVPGPHDFRRACLRQMILNGEDAITVCHYAGHTDVRVTLRYVYQTDDDIRKAHARSSPVDNWL